MNLLQHRVSLLQLDPRSPFPSETKTAKDMVNAWRYSQRLHVVRPDPALYDRDSDAVHDHSELGD